MKKKILISVLLSALLLVALCSCSSKAPFGGTWADYSGNYLTFDEKDAFTGRINGDDVTGKYLVNYNTIALRNKIGASEEVTVAEWDLRGNMFILTIPVYNSDDHTTIKKQVILYRVNSQADSQAN